MKIAKCKSECFEWLWLAGVGARHSPFSFRLKNVLSRKRTKPTNMICPSPDAIHRHHNRYMMLRTYYFVRGNYTRHDNGGDVRKYSFATSKPPVVVVCRARTGFSCAKKIVANTLFSKSRGPNDAANYRRLPIGL